MLKFRKRECAIVLTALASFGFTALSFAGSENLRESTKYSTSKCSGDDATESKKEACTQARGQFNLFKADSHCEQNYGKNMVAADVSESKSSGGEIGPTGSDGKCSVQCEVEFSFSCVGA